MNLLIFTFNGHHWWKLVAMSVKHYQIVTFDIAGEAGFEPTSTVLETAELPLFYSPLDPSGGPEGNRILSNPIFPFSITPSHPPPFVGGGMVGLRPPKSLLRAPSVILEGNRILSNPIFPFSITPFWTHQERNAIFAEKEGCLLCGNTPHFQ